MRKFIPHREELAWAAGFFDGEGTLVLVNAEPKRRRDYLSMTLGIAQHGDDAELLDRFRAAIGGFGSIYGPHAYRGYRTPRYMFMMRNPEGVQHIIACMWPWLGTVKRRQATHTLTTWRADKRTRQPRRTRPLAREV